MPKGDREILKADPEDGTTPIANLLLEAIALAKLTGREKGAILHLCRRTYGWGVGLNRLKKEIIPLDDFAKAIGSDKSNTSRTLKNLESKNIFRREYLGPGKSYVYSINTRVAEWDNGCINKQQLSQVQRLSQSAKQQLSQMTTLPLSPATTPGIANLATSKSILNQIKVNNIENIDIAKVNSLWEKEELTEEDVQFLDGVKLQNHSLWRIRRFLNGEEEASRANKENYRCELEKLGIKVKS